MTLKLMYITNNPDVAIIAENSGVDRIFVDLEFIGKDQRQQGLDTVKSHHTVEDVRAISKALNNAELMVRVNPIHDKTCCYMSSKEEIDAVIDAGASVIMLPYFKTCQEVETFINYVDGRATTFLLLETPEAANILEDILNIKGIDEIHIGLNDMSIGYGLQFMFELLSNDKVEEWCKKIAEKNIPYGFGGIASLGKGSLPAEYVIGEHYRLKSSRVILSRSFCDASKIVDFKEIKEIFDIEIKKIRKFELFLQNKDENYFEENHIKVCQMVNNILNKY